MSLPCLFYDCVTFLFPDRFDKVCPYRLVFTILKMKDDMAVCLRSPMILVCDETHHEVAYARQHCVCTRFIPTV